MKIIKTVSGKSKIKISKKEWQSIGKTAGWEEYRAENSTYESEDYEDEAGWHRLQERHAVQNLIEVAGGEENLRAIMSLLDITLDDVKMMISNKEAKLQRREESPRAW